MKCPVCGAHSYVLETRLPHRKRECANKHKFWTEEVPRDASPTAREPRPPRIDPNAARNQRIFDHWLAVKNYSEVGRVFNLNPETITKIVTRIAIRQAASRSNGGKPKENP